MIPANPQTWRLSLLSFLGLAILGAAAGFALPSSPEAVLDHFLSMSPWGIWKHIIATDQSPIRYAYYMPTGRVGFASQSWLWAPYALAVLTAAMGLRRAKGDVP
ncbi:MAG TPA: hypothetical protein VM901_07285 [Bdellovibrionota bacterium]|jgi:hypothetical protein|nr:hypothetical protein [Bdellovibrionota bacterium]